MCLSMNADTRAIHSLLLALYSKFMGAPLFPAERFNAAIRDAGPCPSGSQPHGFHLVVHRAYRRRRGKAMGRTPRLRAFHAEFEASVSSERDGGRFPLR